jgi:hypothetical protein
MFTAAELRESLEDLTLQEDLRAARLALATARLQQPIEVHPDSISRLLGLIDAVLVSANLGV